MYNRVQNTWTSFLPFNLPGDWNGLGFPISARTSDSKMIIGGGLVNQAQPVVSSSWYQFDANNHSFTQISDGPALYQSAASKLWDGVYVFGGKISDGKAVNDLYRYTFETELMQATRSMFQRQIQIDS